MEELANESTSCTSGRPWGTFGGSPPPASKRAKNFHHSHIESSEAVAHAYDDPQPFADGVSSFITSTPRSDNPSAHTESDQVPFGMSFNQDDYGMEELFDQVMGSDFGVVNMSPPALQDAVQGRSDSFQQLATPPTTVSSLPGLPPQPLPRAGPPAPPPQASSMTAPSQPWLQHQIQFQVQSQSQSQFLSQPSPHGPARADALEDSVLHPNRPSDEFYIPDEAAQRQTFARGIREGQRWVYWERLRLVKTASKSARPHWEAIATDLFFNCRSWGALRAQMKELKKWHADCLVYQEYIGVESDGDLRYGDYDRNLPEPALLDLIDRRMVLLQQRGTGWLSHLTNREYLKWTYDRENGLFALMDRWISQVESDVSSPLPAPLPQGAAGFSVPREPGPIIPDDDDNPTRNRSRTPTSSIFTGPAPSAPPSNIGVAMSTRRSNRGSTRPTSIQTKSAARSDSVRRDLAKKELAEIYKLAHKNVKEYLDMVDAKEKQRLDLAFKVAGVDMGEATSNARALLGAHFAQPLQVPPSDEYRNMVSKEVDEITSKRVKMGLDLQLARHGLQPSEGTSSRG